MKELSLTESSRPDDHWGLAAVPDPCQMGRRSPDSLGHGRAAERRERPPGSAPGQRLDRQRTLLKPVSQVRILPGAHKMDIFSP